MFGARVVGLLTGAADDGMEEVEITGASDKDVCSCVAVSVWLTTVEIETDEAESEAEEVWIDMSVSDIVEAKATPAALAGEEREGGGGTCKEGDGTGVEHSPSTPSSPGAVGAIAVKRGVAAKSGEESAPEASVRAKTG